MNHQKLSDSIHLFKHYYVHNRDFYNEDERAWKVELSDKFVKVFNPQILQSNDFLPSLVDLFTDSEVAQLVKWLGGGSFYQCQRFIDLLHADLDQTKFRAVFREMLFSSGKLKRRVNKFKSMIDDQYSEHHIDGKIQLNLISQFLGLSSPNKYYIYKSREFVLAEKYFEFKRRMKDQSAGEKYEHYYEMSQEILASMKEAGLVNADFIDVQTFVYREDWYSEVSGQEIAEQFAADELSAHEEPIDVLWKKVKEGKPKPARIARSSYHYRDANLSALVKKLAEGVCDLCSEKAPFQNKSGQPYLECHHIHHLAEGGANTVENCAAVCPNCHTKMHVLNLEIDRDKLRKIANRRAIHLNQL